MTCYLNKLKLVLEKAGYSNLTKDQRLIKEIKDKLVEPCP